MIAPRRHMSIYERTLERFARTSAGYWYVTRLAPKLDPPLLRISGGRVSSVYPVPVMLLTIYTSYQAIFDEGGSTQAINPPENV